MSVVDVLAELGGVGRPDGDPTALRDAATRLAAGADGFDRTVDGLGRIEAELNSAWTGIASDAFSGLLAMMRREAVLTAGVLREAAGAVMIYAARLETAQADWASARDGAVAGRALHPLEWLDADFRRAVAQAEQADADARAAAGQLAAELTSLADRAEPLPRDVQPPHYQDRRIGGWLFDLADRAPHDPLGAYVYAQGQFVAGIGDALKGYRDLAVIAGKTNPLYMTVDPVGFVENSGVLVGMLAGLAKLSPVYGALDPRGHARAQQQFVSGLLNLETLRTGNVPRWAGSFVPDIAIAAVTAGTATGAEAATRGGSAAARVAGEEARSASAIRAAATEARLARIAELGEANAYRWLERSEAAGSNSHYLSRHGAQTTIEQQFERATTGRTPDGAIYGPSDASRVF
jgi:hypothetical protein